MWGVTGPLAEQVVQALVPERAIAELALHLRQHQAHLSAGATMLARLPGIVQGLNEKEPEIRRTVAALQALDKEPRGTLLRGYYDHLASRYGGDGTTWGLLIGGLLKLGHEPQEAVSAPPTPVPVKAKRGGRVYTLKYSKDDNLARSEEHLRLGELVKKIPLTRQQLSDELRGLGILLNRRAVGGLASGEYARHLAGEGRSRGKSLSPKLAEDVGVALELLTQKYAKAQQ